MQAGKDVMVMAGNFSFKLQSSKTACVNVMTSGHRHQLTGHTVNSTLLAHYESSITNCLNRNTLGFLFISPVTIELNYSQK